MKFSNELIVSQGTTARWFLQIKNQDGFSIDLTSASFKGQVRTTYNSPIVEASFNFEVTDTQAGELYMSLTPTQTEALSYTKYVYDVEVTEPSGSTNNIYRIMEGTLTVKPRVTI